MAEFGFKGSPPAYKGDGVSIWIGTKKDGEKYLKVKILGMPPVACWKVDEAKAKPKPEIKFEAKMSDLI